MITVNYKETYTYKFCLNITKQRFKKIIKHIKNIWNKPLIFSYYSKYYLLKEFFLDLRKEEIKDFEFLFIIINRDESDINANATKFNIKAIQSIMNSLGDYNTGLLNIIIIVRKKNKIIPTIKYHPNIFMKHNKYYFKLKMILNSNSGEHMNFIRSLKYIIINIIIKKLME